MRKKTVLILIVIIVAAAGAFTWWWSARSSRAGDLDYESAAIISTLDGKYFLDESGSEDVTFIDDWESAPRLSGISDIEISRDGLYIANDCYCWDEVTILETEEFVQFQVAGMVCDYNTEDGKIYVYSYSDQVESIYGVYARG